MVRISIHSTDALSYQAHETMKHTHLFLKIDLPLGVGTEKVKAQAAYGSTKTRPSALHERHLLFLGDRLVQSIHVRLTRRQVEV